MEDAYPYLYPPDTDGAIIDAYLAALEHPRFGPSDDERVQARERDEEEHEVERSKLAGLYTMRSIAVHHIACYFFTASAVVPEGMHLADSVARPASRVNCLGSILVGNADESVHEDHWTPPRDEGHAFRL